MKWMKIPERIIKEYRLISYLNGYENEDVMITPFDNKWWLCSYIIDGNVCHVRLKTKELAEFLERKFRIEGIV